MHTSFPKSAPAHGPDAGTAEDQRARLAEEIALSDHEVVSWKCFALAAKGTLWAALALFLGVIFLAATFAMVKKNLVPSAIFGGCVTLVSFLLGMWLISKSLQTYTDRIADISVCPTGLRWHKGEQQFLALWSEIAVVDVAWDVPQTGMTGLVGAVQAWSAKATINSVTIKWHTGESLVLRAATLTDIERFANTVKDRHALSIQKGNQVKGVRGSFLPR
jgi:hypothetical protein